MAGGPTPLQVRNQTALQVDLLSGSMTVKVVSGDTVYYADQPYVNSTDNQGSIALNASHTFTTPVWLKSASLSAVTVTQLLTPGQDIVLGSDGAVGGPGGTGLTTAVAQAVSIATTPALTLTTTGGPTNGALVINQTGNAAEVTMQTDWGANLTGNTTYDSVDIFHKSAGDGVYVVHSGGVSQANLPTGTVAANNGIAYLASPALSGTAQNAVTIAHVVAGLNTALTVGVVGSAVTVNVATDGSGSATSTATQVIAAVNASATALAKLSAYNLSDATGTSTGVGVVAAVTATNLAGGFTGSTPGANSAFNAYVPYWKDDTGSGAGTLVANRQGRIALQAANLSSLDKSGNAVRVAHTAGGAAVNIFNQQPGQGGVPQVDGTAISLSINEWSTGASVFVTRNTAPKAGTGVFQVSSTLGATVFPVHISSIQDASQALWLNNDGSAAFGRSAASAGPIATLASGAPVRVQIAQSYTGISGNLVLSNEDTTVSSGASINFNTSTRTAAVISSRNDALSSSLPTQSSMKFIVLQASSQVTALILQGTAATFADGISIATGTTTGMKIGTVGGASGQKLGFFAATPIVQPLLATGAAHTVDDVITTLQNLGLVRQS